MGASLGVENLVCCTTRGDEAAARLVKNRLGPESTCKSCSCSLPVFLEILVVGMSHVLIGQFPHVGSTEDMIQSSSLSWRAFIQIYVYISICIYIYIYTYNIRILLYWVDFTR